MQLDGLDLFGDADLFKDGPPHALFARLRAESPIHRTPNPHGGTVWSLFRHDDITAVSKDAETFSSARKGIFLQTDQVIPLDLSRNVLLYKDPPDHSRFRKILQPLFTPAAVAQLGQMVQRRVTQAIDAVIEAGRCDFVASVAVPVPLGVLTEIMGVPDADIPRFYEWTEAIEAAQRSLEPNAAAETFLEMSGYLFERLQAQQSDEGTLVHRLAEADLGEDEILTFFALLAFAGNDTVRNTTANAMLALLEHPDQLARLRDDPALIDGAVDELLRFTSVVQWFARTATADTELGGVKIAEGDLVITWFGSASRDGAVFADPDRFDVERDDAGRHKAFGGGGRHSCLGKHLARLELRTIFTEVLSRMEDIELDGEPERLGSNWANALTALPVRFNPGPPRAAAT